VLRSFIAFAQQRGDRYVRNARVLAWAAEASSPEHRRSRLLAVRRFALAMHAENVRHQIPEADALGHVIVKRRAPYTYSPDHIVRLLRAAAALEPAGSIRPLMYTTLFGLLAATGARIAEALALQLHDVTADGLVIRDSAVAAHPSGRPGASDVPLWDQVAGPRALIYWKLRRGRASTSLD
jgi:integrase